MVERNVGRSECLEAIYILFIYIVKLSVCEMLLSSFESLVNAAAFIFLRSFPFGCFLFFKQVLCM